MGQSLPWRKVESWWNGSFGRLNQRRVWLWTNGAAWCVEVRQGDGDARVWERTFVSEADARLLLRERKEAATEKYRDEWKQLPT